MTDPVASRSAASLPAEVPLGALLAGSGRPLFWRPRYAVASEALWHVPFAFWLAEVAAPRTLVQLGLGDGVTYFALCQAMDKLMPEAICLGIEGAARTIPGAIARHNEANYRGLSRLLGSGPSPWSERLAGVEIDLLVLGLDLDGPTVAALERDWMPRLSRRGVVLVERANRLWDDGEPSPLPELRDDRPSIHLEEGDGMLAILRGEAPPPALCTLARAPLGDPGGERAREAFARIGAAHRHEARCAAHEEAETAMAERLDAANAEMRRLAATAERREGVERTLAVKAREAAVAKAQAFDATAEAEARKREARGLRERLDATIRALGERDEAMGRLETALAEARDEGGAAEARARTALEQAGRERAARAASERALAERGAEVERVRRAAGDQKTVLELRAAAVESAMAEQAEVLRCARARVECLDASAARREAEIEALRTERKRNSSALEALREERRALAEGGEARRRVEAALRAARLAIAVGRRPTLGAASPGLARQVAALRKSDLFDAAWYRGTHGILGGLRWSAEVHYARAGSLEGLDPGPSFETMAYYLANPDVAEAGYPALVHYLIHGREEERPLKP